MLPSSWIGSTTCQELAVRYRVQGIPAVKAFRNGHVVDEFVGALPPQLGQFLDRLTRPSEAERLFEEFRVECEWPDVLAAMDTGELERALELLLARLAGADENERERIRRPGVALSADVGTEHPLAFRYRRWLATALY